MIRVAYRRQPGRVEEVVPLEKCGVPGCNRRRLKTVPLCSRCRKKARKVRESHVRARKPRTHRLAADLESAVFVYAIRAGSHAVKFGFAGNPEQRLADLQIGNHLQLAIDATLWGPRELESAIHRYLRECRLCGEWFGYSERTKVVINFMKSGNLSGLRALLNGASQDRRQMPKSTRELKFPRKGA